MWPLASDDAADFGIDLGDVVEALLNLLAEDRDGACPTLALPSDVSRSSAAVKRAFRKVLDSMLSAFVSNLQGSHARERGIALVSVCVGAMVVARAVDDPALATSFRKAARKHVLASSGWGTQ